MSNPGVVTLENFTLPPSLPVRIEDNLAESVHVHVGPIRLDLSLAQMHTLAEDSSVLLDTFLSPFGLTVENFDRQFLGEIGWMLKDLEGAQFKRVLVSELKVAVKRNRLRRHEIVPIPESEVIKAMHGKFEGYSRTFKLPETRAKERIHRAKAISAMGEYGQTGERIVIFNDQMLIRDGQHRAAVLYSDNPDSKVEVICLKFRDNLHCIPRFPLLASAKNIRLRHVRRFAGRFVRFVQHVCRRVESKMNRIQNVYINGRGSQE